LTFLLLNQTFHPDVMATGQYLTEVAVRLAERGHGVTVVTGRRAYDRPEERFAGREVWRGIRIFRVFSTGFGKSARWRRAADFASFVISCCARLLLLPRHQVVVALTTPPLIGFIGACVARVRGSRFVYWVMDFNPDEAIAAGWLRADSVAGRVLEWMSRFSLRRADRIIALDRFMRDRIVAKGVEPAKVVVIPPWSHDTEVKFDPAGRERFRKAHGLDGKFVVMYSGNHSPVHPLDTLLGAARRFAADQDVVFCFVGGGSEWRKIADAHRVEDGGPKTEDGRQEREKQKLGRQKAETGSESSGLSTLNPQPSTVRCLHYQPLDQLAGSLSAADLHVAVMGNGFVGLVHPCKIYNILSVGAPVLYIGPRPSHLSELLDNLVGEYPCAAAEHGEVDRVVEAIQRLHRQPVPGLCQAPDRARALFSRETLLPKLIAELESV